ncbi:translation initiation factor 2 [Desulfolucanica intricata]|uniref:translation initiation factor 2 n=1 Tax=Desulfolucanica intricata TaxID=1285191 RepID=UPI000833C817|nr:translation initiation factor 2 [Desulfolucanica intricata]
MDIYDINYLQQRVHELEEKIEQLRLSRRVLMNLVEKLEREKSGFVTRLEKENRKLHMNNCRYAKYLLRKNRQIMELKTQLKKAVSDNSVN